MAKTKLTNKEILDHSKALAISVLGEEQFKKNKVARDEIMSHFKTGALWAEALIHFKIKLSKTKK